MTLPRIDRPQPGFFETRLVKGGPKVPARIWLDDSIPERPAILLAECNGKDCGVDWLWTRVAGRNITEAEYRYLCGVKDWAEQHAPQAPEAQPRQAVDFRTIPMPF